MGSQSNLKQILNKYRQQLSEILGNELDSVLLYGSQARGEAGAGSDTAAQVLIQDGYYDFAASWADYAMFYVASALLADLRLSWKKNARFLVRLPRYFNYPPVFWFASSRGLCT